VPDRLTAHNDPHLQAIAGIAQSGRLVPLVGAGTSIACKYPGWTEFLGRLEEPLREKMKADYLDELRKSDIRTRLDHLVSHLGDDYASIFKDTFQPKGDGRAMPSWIRLVFDLPVGLVLTTNYTSELEQIARFHPSSPLGDSPTPVRWHVAPDVARAIRQAEGRTRLIYVHGRYDDWPGIERDPQGLEWSRVVLGEKSYRYAYEHPGTLRERLKAVCQTSTLLVIGASLHDDDITGTLRFARAISGSGQLPHYAILPLSSGSDPGSIDREYFDRFGLRLMFYPTIHRSDGSVDHDGIADLLQDLVQRAVPPSTTRREIPYGRVTLDAYPPKPRVVHPLLRPIDFIPRPTYARALDLFLTQGSGGVLALIGIGGSGKTAMVGDAVANSRKRFDGLFMWSFYDDPDPGAFFTSLADYVRGTPVSENTSEVQAYEEMRRSYLTGSELLLVLDGLERLQVERPDSRQLHGTVQDTILRQLLLWLAQAPVAARAIITTRFPLPDLLEASSAGRVTLLEVDALTRAEARVLLKKKGVRGTDRELDLLLDYFGAHALTVDHLGSVLVQFLNGDPKRFRELGEGPLTRFEVGQAGAKLARVLHAYQLYLSRSEPEVQDTLSRVAIFTRPVTTKTLADVFLDPRRQDRAGTLAGKTQVDLDRYLNRLRVLGLLQLDISPAGVRYSLHPAVRDVVLQDLRVTRQTLAGAAREEAEARLARLDLRPGFGLDVLDELIGFSIDEGRDAQAFDLYCHRLGPYARVGWVFGDYARGERVARYILNGASEVGGISQRNRDFLTLDLGLYLETLGRVEEARRIFSDQLATGRWRDTPDALLRMAEAEWLAGRIPAMEAMASAALEPAEAGNDIIALCQCAAMRARAALWRGRIQEAATYFGLWQGQKRLTDNHRSGQGGTDYAIRSMALDILEHFYLHIAWLQFGAPEDIQSRAEKALAASQRLAFPALVARSWLVMGEMHRRLNHPEEARDFVRRAREWALLAGHQEILLWARLLGANLHFGSRAALLDELTDGLRAADACGYGLLQIDLRNALARQHFAMGQEGLASELALRALTMASDGQCEYYWGKVEAHEILALVLDASGNAEEAAVHLREGRNLRVHLEAAVDVMRAVVFSDSAGSL
jgi:hypothetical protein